MKLHVFVRLRLLLSLFSLLSWIDPQIAGAWGVIGHQAVGLIAEKELTPSNRLAVLDLLNGENLDSAAVWADKIKSIPSWNHTRSYHYADMPDDMDYMENLQNLSPQELAYGDTVRALLKAEDILRDSGSNRADKRFALKFMAHFIGDIHQPLHVGRVEDKGGNTILVEWFGGKSNLHAVWDTLMIATFVERNNEINKKPVKLQDYMAALRTPLKKEISKWQNSYVLTWFKESLMQRNGAYSGDANESELYFNKNFNLPNEKILRAGYRLGAWLNSIFTNPDALSVDGRKLRSDLDSVLGPKNGDQIRLTEQNIAVFNPLKSYRDPCANHSH